MMHDIKEGYTMQAYNDTRLDFRLDLTQYSDRELSLHVMNDEYFYNERGNKDYLMALINEQFEYTQEQLDELLNDLAEEQESPLYDCHCKDNDEELNQCKN